MHFIPLLAQQSSAGAGTGVAIVGGIWLIVLLIALLASVFWIWMLIDCLTSSLPSTEKLIWAVVILFLHLLAAILYFAIARKGTTRSTSA